MDSDSDNIEDFVDEQGYLSDDGDGGVTVFEGQRKGRIFNLGDYYYYQEKYVPRTGTRYFRCSEKVSHKCKARARKEIGKDMVMTPGFTNHNHPANEAYGEFLIKRKELLKLLLNQQHTSMTRIYKDFLKEQRQEVRVLFSLQSMKDSVDYVRRKKRPNRVKNLYDVESALDDPDFAYLGRTKDDKQDFFRGMVGKEGQESLAFFSDRGLKMVRKTDTVASDATYRVTPRLAGALQVLILAVFAFGHAFPFAFFVMRGKSTSAYASCLQKLKDHGLKVDTAITDWEDAERNAWYKVYPRIQLFGCVWHFIRCLHRKAKSLGLGKLWEIYHKVEEDTTTLILRLCCLLPRLPGNKIEDGYNYVKEYLKEVTPDTVKFKTMKFLDYVYAEWVDRPDVDAVSVHGRHIAATSGLESINRAVNAAIDDAHPTFWKYLNIIKVMEEDAWDSYINVRRTGQGHHRTREEKRPKRLLEMDMDILRQKATFSRTQDIGTFLISAQTSLRNDFMALKLTPDDDPIEPIEEDPDDPNEDDFEYVSYNEDNEDSHMSNEEEREESEESDEDEDQDDSSSDGFDEQEKNRIETRKKEEKERKERERLEREKKKKEEERQERDRMEREKKKEEQERQERDRMEREKKKKEEERKERDRMEREKKKEEMERKERSCQEDQTMDTEQNWEETEMQMEFNDEEEGMDFDDGNGNVTQDKKRIWTKHRRENLKMKTKQKKREKKYKKRAEEKAKAAAEATNLASGSSDRVLRPRPSKKAAP